MVILDQPAGDDRDEEDEDEEYVVGDQVMPAVPGEAFTHSTSDLPDEGVEGTYRGLYLRASYILCLVIRLLCS